MSGEGRVLDLGKQFYIRGGGETKHKAVRHLLRTIIRSARAAVEYKIEQCVHQQKTIRFKCINDVRIRGHCFAQEKVCIASAHASKRLSNQPSRDRDPVASLNGDTDMFN